jgi:MoaA/NifB/PqqE/SkfB family radical SAM enzyme
MLKRLLTFATHRIYNLPVIVLMPHSRCNCRCVMCDIWKANHIKKELTVEELEKHVKTFDSLGVKEIVFSGGEALMHSNLWNLCAVLKKEKIRLTLLSTGLLLERNATHIIQYFDNVIISIDGSQPVHDRIRNIPEGYAKIVSGILRLRKIKPAFKITARCVLQRHNFADFFNIVESVKRIGLDQISFLAADVSTSAFNHAEGLVPERISEIALTNDETIEFEKIILRSFIELKQAYETKFIAESPEKMLKIVRYYKAVNGKDSFPKTICNAPWVSAVIESNGDVMPCFFHKPYGNIYNDELASILNSQQAINFRKNLSMDDDAICQKCVCSLKLGVTQMN